MLRVERYPLKSMGKLREDQEFIDNVNSAFSDIDICLQEDLKECALLQEKSEAFVMSLAGDSF